MVLDISNTTSASQYRIRTIVPTFSGNFALTFSRQLTSQAELFLSFNLDKDLLFLSKSSPLNADREKLTAKPDQKVRKQACKVNKST